MIYPKAEWFTVSKKNNLLLLTASENSDVRDLL